MISDSACQSNSAEEAGGAVRGWMGSGSILPESSFQSNRTPDGGAIFAYYASAAV
jgi:hypothetical protein